MLFIVCFFFNDTATTEIYPYLHTLSLHGALPIYPGVARQPVVDDLFLVFHDHSLLQGDSFRPGTALPQVRSEEHTSELQSLMRISYAVFCLKKKNNNLLATNTYNHKPKQRRFLLYEITHQ